MVQGHYLVVYHYYQMPCSKLIIKLDVSKFFFSISITDMQYSLPESVLQCTCGHSQEKK